MLAGIIEVLGFIIIIVIFKTRMSGGMTNSEH